MAFGRWKNRRALKNEFGGLPGIGVNSSSIPCDALKVDTEKKVYIFDQKRDTMEDAPGFDMDHWPDTNIHLERIYGGWSFMG